MSDIYTVFDSPVGDLLLGAAAPGEPLRRLWFLGPGTYRQAGPIDASWRRDDEAFADLSAQLREYFAGTRHKFDVELDLIGTDWERRVWSALLAIPYGETRSYGEIASSLCTIRAARAVGLANGANPVAVIVPCHRVIGADGRLTGFGGGIERKRTLLDLEAGRLALTWPGAPGSGIERGQRRREEAVGDAVGDAAERQEARDVQRRDQVDRDMGALRAELTQPPGDHHPIRILR